MRQWEVFPEHLAESVQVKESPVSSRGQSLYIEMARGISIEQSFPWVVFAGESHLHLSFRGYAADFYVNIYYEGESVPDGFHFYGHWSDDWVNEQIPVSTERGIVRLEFLFLGAWEFYLDDITLDGSAISPPPFLRPGMRKIPEEIYDYDLRFPQPPLQGRLEGIERELKRISALLSKQQYPNLNKDIEEAFTKHSKKDTSGSKK